MNIIQHMYELFWEFEGLTISFHTLLLCAKNTRNMHLHTKLKMEKHVMVPHKNSQEVDSVSRHAQRSAQLHSSAEGHHTGQ